MCVCVCVCVFWDARMVSLEFLEYTPLMRKEEVEVWWVAPGEADELNNGSWRQNSLL